MITNLPFYVYITFYLALLFSLVMFYHASTWEKRIDKILNPFLERNEKVEALINRSFLNEATKRAYWLCYNTRRNRLSN